MSNSDLLKLAPLNEPPMEYPIEELGPMLCGAALAIASKIQVPFALAAQSVLAAASLAVQPLANVGMPYGQPRPTSLYCVTISSSGDRKTSADNEAVSPIRQIIKESTAEYKKNLRSWKIRQMIWERDQKRILRDPNLTNEETLQMLEELCDEPLAPVKNEMISSDPTLEGLSNNWAILPAGIGIFTAEGGQFTGGHAMASESKLRTAGGLSELWDGKSLQRIRVSGVSIINGRRLAMHLLIQPEASKAFLTDIVLKDQGLLSRVLVAAPDSIAGTRTYRVPQPDDDLMIAKYHDRLSQLLKLPWPIRTQAEGLQPRNIPLSEDALKIYIEMYNYIELSLGAGGEFHDVSDFAAKTAEHMVRIAGVITIINDENSKEISGDVMKSAAILGHWYLMEFQRLRKSNSDPSLMQAYKLLNWMKSRNNSEVRFSDILQLGPAQTRVKRDAETAMNLLMEHNLAIQLQSRPRTYVLNQAHDKSITKL